MGRAITKYIRLNPRKVGQVLDKIRGKKVSDAYNALLAINRRSVGPIKKTLDAAVANSDAKDIVDKIKITKAWVGQGPSMKRMRPRSMGRAEVYKRPTSHIEIEVG